MVTRTGGAQESHSIAIAEEESHTEFLARYAAEAARLGIRLPDAGDWWAAAYRGCHKDLWPDNAAKAPASP